MFVVNNVKIHNQIYCYLTKNVEFAVVATDKICGRSLSLKIPVDMNSIYMKLYVTEIWIFEVIFVDFRLTKNNFV